MRIILINKSKKNTNWKIYFLFLIAFYSSHAKTQYSIDTFTVKYDTLTNYNSIVLENLINQKQWSRFEKDFNLGFEFPFFDKFYKKVNFQSYGVGLLNNGIGWYNFYVFDNFWNICEEPDDLSYSKFDYRYVLEKVGNTKVFKIEWFNTCLYNTRNEIVRPFNFQLWLWEDGKIDMITGKMTTNDTTLYVPGTGFIHEIGNPGNLGIVNPENTYALFYEGDYKNPNILQGHPDSILYFNRGTIKTLPHEGFVVRFKKSISSVHDKKNQIPIPNIVSDELLIPEDILFAQFHIFDTKGALLKQGQERNIAIGNLHNGLYIIRLMNGKEVWTYKFLKQ